MRKAAICFSRRGMTVIERINRSCLERGIRPAEAYFCMEDVEAPDGFVKVQETVKAWTQAHFDRGEALVFVGAAGIAVRALSGLASDKLSDSPVIVIDDNGRFVIPLLSGHAGGANKLAMTLAALLAAVPVITTATDVNGCFSADTFAAEHRLTVGNREGIRKVSARALEGKSITLCIKDYPPDGPVDVMVADETDAEYSLILRPKPYTVGLGMKKGIGEGPLEEFFLRTLEEEGIRTEEVYALCTIDRKAEEPALLFLSGKYRIPVLAFDKNLLNRAPGRFTGSEFVRQTTGVDNVCERSAVLGAGPSACLIRRKQARDGMTIAVARRSHTVIK